MKQLFTTIQVVSTTCLLMAGGAQAALVTTAAPLGPSTVIDFQQFTSVALANAVPVQVGTIVGEDVELYGIGSYDTYVGPMSHNLAGNGSWNSTVDPNFRGVNLPVSTALAMEFVFNTGPVRGVGAFMNYTPGYGPVLLEAFDAGGILLETYDLVAAAPINTGPTSVNDGAFRGILRATPDITSFRLTGPWPVLDDLTFTRVPEPASLAMLSLGASACLKRRQSM